MNRTLTALAATVALLVAGLVGAGAGVGNASDDRSVSITALGT